LASIGVSIIGNAEPLDLIQFARITASDTRDQFIGLWPRETDDAPYTVRDNDKDTSWKIPPYRNQILTLDFAPIMSKAPKLESLNAEWQGISLNPVKVRARAYCGGNILEEGTWYPLTEPFHFESAVSSYCLELIFQDSGNASLVQLHIYAATTEAPSALKNVKAISEGNMVHFDWSMPDERTAFVQIHYVKDLSTPLNGASLVGMASSKGSWKGPLPSNTEMMAIVVPVAEDGQMGAITSVKLPARATPVLQTSGVVEGFYGRPWSHEERRAIIVHLAKIGLGLYIYGPKNDPLHRDQWRAKYDNEALTRFEELHKLGDLLGVIFSFGISPGKDMVMDDPNERATLIDKLSPFLDKGFRHFTLLLDDIEGSLEVPVDAALADKHVQLANWLKNQLGELAGSEVELWLVPTVYSTQRQNDWPGGAEYLDVLKNLDPDIVVMWTGTDTFSPTLNSADLADVTSRIGRKPAIWDNEHATDGGDAFWGKVYLAPYEGRSADLVDAIEGVVANPMILGSANRLILGTYASYLFDPTGYHPDNALSDSTAAETTNEADNSLALQLAKTFHGSGIYGFNGLNFPHNPEMDQSINDLKKMIENGSLDQIIGAGSNLLNIAAKMATTQNDMHHSGLDESLVDDLWFPSYRLTHEGWALIKLLDWFGSQLSGNGSSTDMILAELYLFKALFDRYQLSPFVVDFFSLYLNNHKPDALGFEAPTIVMPSSNPKVGELWEYLPSPDAIVNIYGLPGSHNENGNILWTPPHPGTYQALVVAQGDKGWAYQEIHITVSESQDDDSADDDINDDDLSGDDDSLANPKPTAEKTTQPCGC